MFGKLIIMDHFVVNLSTLILHVTIVALVAGVINCLLLEIMIFGSILRV